MTLLCFSLSDQLTDSIRKLGEIGDGEAFSAYGRLVTTIGDDGIDLLARQLGEACRERVCQRFSALCKRCLDGTEEQLLALGAAGLVVLVKTDADDRRIDLGCRHEAVGGNVEQLFRLAVVGEHRGDRAVILTAGGGGEAVGDLLYSRSPNAAACLYDDLAFLRVEFLFYSSNSDSPLASRKSTVLG